jgi:putative endonuclease
MIIVYAIKRLERNYIYVGMTNDLNRRIQEHNNGENKSTKSYRPFILIYSESFPDRVSAREKEKYLKSGVGKEYLRSLKF